MYKRAKRLSAFGLSKLLVRFKFCKQTFNATDIKRGNVRNVKPRVVGKDDCRLLIKCIDMEERKKLERYLIAYHEVKEVYAEHNPDEPVVEVGVSYFTLEDKRKYSGVA